MMIPETDVDVAEREGSEKIIRSVIKSPRMPHLVCSHAFQQVGNYYDNFHWNSKELCRCQSHFNEIAAMFSNIRGLV